MDRMQKLVDETLGIEVEVPKRQPTKNAPLALNTMTLAKTKPNQKSGKIMNLTSTQQLKNVFSTQFGPLVG